MHLPHTRKDKSGYYITLWQMLRHQFVISIRTVGKTVDSATLLTELGTAQRRAFRNCGKATLFAFVSFMIGLNSTPGAPANVSLLGHAIALPAVFVNFFVAFCYFQILHTGLNGLLVGEFARTAASIRCGQKGAMASRISYDIDSSWAMSVTPFFGFLNSGKLHLAFSTLGAFSIFFPLGLVVLALAVDVAQVSFQELLVEGIFSLSGVMSFSSILLVVFSTIFAICLFVPFYFSRNVDFVRWNFLYPLLYRNCNYSPTVDHWLKENEAKAKR